MISETLTSDIVALLKKKLKYTSNIWTDLDHIILEISDDNFQWRMGSIIQQIQNIIDQHYPHRQQELCIIIKNIDTMVENPIKIWKSV